jgi:hypothetical protein
LYRQRRQSGELLCRYRKPEIVEVLAGLPRRDLVFDHLLAGLHPPDLRKKGGGPASDLLGADLVEIEARLAFIGDRMHHGVP